MHTEFTFKIHPKDMSALDSINTAMKTFIAEPDSKYTDGVVYNLTGIMASTVDVNGVVKPILSEVFDMSASPATFNGDSDAFENVDADDVLIGIKDGAVSIYVESDDLDYSNYVVGDGASLAGKSVGDTY